MAGGSAERDRSEIRILSIDGGGVRGIMPAYWLCELQSLLSAKIADQTIQKVFDWYAGTSTGSIVAAGIAFGKTPTEILELYRKEARTIFPELIDSRWYKPWRWTGAITPKHADAGLNAVLQKVFGPTRLGDLPLADSKKRLLIVSYNASSRRMTLFDSDNPQHADILVWQACRASAAAPTYLPEFELALTHGVPEPFLDGGIAANNPSAVAVGIALNLRLSDNSVLLASFGTGVTGNGYSASRSRKYKWGGLLPWGADITSTIMTAGSDAHEKITDDLLRPGVNYFRFNVPLNLAQPQLDDASTQNMRDLISDARAYWAKGLTQSAARSLVEKLDSKTLPDLRKLAGLWKSTFTDETDQDTIPGEQIIEIKVLGHAFLSGNSRPEDDSPGVFEAGLYGGYIVGQWLNSTGSQASMFMLRMEDENNLVGRWIGSIDRAQSPIHGVWTLTRTP